MTPCDQPGCPVCALSPPIREQSYYTPKPVENGGPKPLKATTISLGSDTIHTPQLPTLEERVAELERRLLRLERKQ